MSCHWDASTVGWVCRGCRTPSCRSESGCWRSSRPEPGAGWRNGERDALIVRTPEGTAALLVDAVIDEREVTVRDLGGRLTGAPGLLGGVLLADGSSALLLNAAVWERRALEEPARTAGSSPSQISAPRVLLAEDSLTTRTLERSILEAAGYDVTVAVDGAEAWRLLQRHGADLVVADVDMPNMDGFALCEAIRTSERFADLPVVLVTSLAEDRHRARGLEVGASAYFVKSAFDQEAAGLADTIGPVAELVTRIVELTRTREG